MIAGMACAAHVALYNVPSVETSARERGGTARVRAGCNRVNRRPKAS